VWANAVDKNTTFYLEETKSYPEFRLNVDIDIKLTTNGPMYNIINEHWLEILMEFTRTFFGKSANLDVVVTECHGPYSDQRTITSQYKSGYRLYFRNIWCNDMQHQRFTQGLADTFKNKLVNYPHQPDGWTWYDVIDCHPLGKNRLHGTIKQRRGRDIPRRYSFVGVFGEDGALKQPETDALKKKYCCISARIIYKEMESRTSY